MAGEGSRFKAAGYTFPKPLIEVCGKKPMIQVVIESLKLPSDIFAEYIFLVRDEHLEKYHLREFLNRLTPGCSIIPVMGLTEGAACTTLLAKDLINNEEKLLIANSDQYFTYDREIFDIVEKHSSIDGAIFTFKSNHPKWSYAKTVPDTVGGRAWCCDIDRVTEVAEKNPISDNATVGVYYWKKGSDYVKYAEQMIVKNIRTNNEFYVCPVFNEAIADGLIFDTIEAEEMWGLGTPEDLRYFESKHDTI